MKQKQLLFSVTASDCEWQTMTAGGPGGQHQQRNRTAVRCVHKASGATGESREFKSQIQNKRSAFVKMANTTKFRSWLNVEAAKRLHCKSPEERVDEMLQPPYLKVERRNEKGGWVEWLGMGQADELESKEQ